MKYFGNCQNQDLQDCGVLIAIPQKILAKTHRIW